MSLGVLCFGIMYPVLEEFYFKDFFVNLLYQMLVCVDLREVPNTFVRLLLKTKPVYFHSSDHRSEVEVDRRYIGAQLLISQNDTNKSLKFVIQAL